jgi:peptidyl-prolyl cis-trans isomerase C
MTIKNKSCGAGLSCFLYVLIAIAFMTGPAFGADKEDKIAATVGDVQISESALAEAVNRYVPPGTYHVGIGGAQKDKYRKEALDQLVEVELLYKEARKRQVLISDAKISEIVKENIKKFGSEKKFKDALKKSKLTLNALRERIRKVQSVNNLNEILRAEAEPSEDAVRADYERNKARYMRPESMHVYHILLKVEPAATEAEAQKKKEEAEAILKRIRAGEEFGALAYELSEDPYKVKSGDLGYIHRGQFDPRELEDVVFGLKEGGVSEVVRTIHGFHILKAGEKRPEELLKFEEVKETIKNGLQSKNLEEKRNTLLNSLRKEYPVQVLIVFEKEAPGQDAEKTKHH